MMSSGYLPHHLSCEALKSELDLHSIPPTQTCILDTSLVEYYSISSAENQQVIDFHIVGNGEDYIDPSQIYLHVQVDIKKVKNIDLTDNDNVIPINGLLHSMFSDIIVQLGDKIITSADQAYPYKAYFARMFMGNTHAINNYLNMEMFYKEPFFTKLNDNILKNDFIKEKLLKSKNTIDMFGKPCIDLFNQDRLLPNDLDMRIKLIRNKNEFCLIKDETVRDGSRAHLDDFQINIKKISLFVRKVKLNPSVMLAQIKSLSLSTFKYPMLRTEIRTQCIGNGMRDIHLDNLFLGPLPVFIMFGLVDSDAFAGTMTSNPFYFHNKNISHVSIQIDSQQYPVVPLQPDFKNNMFIMCYHHFLTSIGKYYDTDGLDISLENYANGCTLFPFDLTSDQNIDVSHFNLAKNGSLRINLKFNESLDKNMILVVYALFQSIIEIDKNKSVITDY